MDSRHPQTDFAYHQSDEYGVMREILIPPRITGQGFIGNHKVVGLISGPDGLIALPTTSNLERPVSGTVLDHRIYGTVRDALVMHEPLFVAWSTWHAGRHWLTLSRTTTDALLIAVRPQLRHLGVVSKARAS